MSDDGAVRTPHDIEAERSVLGAVMLDNDLLPSVVPTLQPAHFFRAAHATIYAATLRLHEQASAIDIVTLVDVLGRSGQLESVGGPVYIASLIDGVPRSTNVEHYARIVRRDADARALMAAARRAIHEVSEDPESLAAGGIRLAETAASLASGRTVDRAHEQRVAEAVDRERAKREALRRIDAAVGGTQSVPEFESLAAHLARPLPVTRYRIAEWWPVDARVVLAAQFKAGKTTLVGNVVRSLVDSDLFLGRHAVHPQPGTVAVVDAEMSQTQLVPWYRDQGIRHAEHVIMVPLRGRAAAFNILDPVVRSEWAGRFAALGVRTVVIDCVRPLLDALGLDEHRDAGRFLVALDALLAEAGIREALIVVHMGHVGERARGDSRFRDWPDVEWRLVRQDDNPSSARFLTAYGRDVDVPEQKLTFDPQTRRMTLGEGSRQDVKTFEALTDVIDVLKAGEMSGRAVLRALVESCHAKAAIEGALKRGVRTGALASRAGNRRAILYSIGSSAPVPPSDSPVPQVTSAQCPSAFIGTGTRALSQGGTSERF